MTSLVPYDPTLPHVALQSYSEDASAAKLTDVRKRSFEDLKNSAPPLAQKWKEQIVTGIALGLSHLYVDQEMGEKMASIITTNFGKGLYDRASNPTTFKELVLNDIKAVCPDKHLGLLYSEQPLPEYDPDRSLKTLRDDELTQQQKEYLDGGGRPDFSKGVESYIIPNTEIGYFKINFFPALDLPDTKAIIDEAMKNILGAKTLIIDLRENRGGNPATVAYVASYLFDQKLLINQMFQRENHELTSFYAEPETVDQSFGGQKPIYVLTSSQTFSGGEELAYDLQSTKRATVIGQTTVGGAHPTRLFVVDDHTAVAIPHAKAINPYTGTNWEGTGVIPDHALAEDTDALAFTRALLDA